jgi:hypothetical protein
MIEQAKQLTETNSQRTHEFVSVRISSLFKSIMHFSEYYRKEEGRVSLAQARHGGAK